MDRSIDELAKKRGLNRSEIAELAFKIALDVENLEDAGILSKIVEIDNQIEKLIFEKKLFIEQLKATKDIKNTIKLKKEKDMAFKSVAKELRETFDIKPENLSKNAKILGITEKELYKQVTNYLEGNNF